MTVFRVALVAAGVVLAQGGAQAQDTSTAVRDVIAAQVEAFRADDVDKAFGYASPMIEAMFGTPDRFGRMVRQGYPMVWRPAELSFVGMREVEGRIYQDVLFTDQAGRSHLLEYEMVQTEAGWEINGVRFKPQSGFGA
ncbi:MAG: DUF4864 domain-containing protein [Pseudomonadota bacterium]